MKNNNNKRLKQLIGIVVRNLRRGKGYTQQDLADLTKMHRSYLADIERGYRNIAVTNLARIADALGVSLATFFTQADVHVLKERGLRFVGQCDKPAKARGEAGPSLLRIQGRTIRDAIDSIRSK